MIRTSENLFQVQHPSCSTLRPGECYEIVVGGDGSEGDYVLSINCTIANTTIVPVGCGSVVTGSTVGLGRKHHVFCAKEFARVEASTSGSSFSAHMQLNDTVFDYRSCTTDFNAYCMWFNVR